MLFDGPEDKVYVGKYLQMETKLDRGYYTTSRNFVE